MYKRQAYGHLVLVNAAGGINFWFANNDTYNESGKAAINEQCYTTQASSKFCEEWLAIEGQIDVYKRQSGIWEPRALSTRVCLISVWMQR